MDIKHLQRHLRRFGRRLMILWIMAGVVLGCAAALVIWLNGAWLDLLWELPPAARIAWNVAGIISILAFPAAATFLAFRNRSPASLARRLDRAAESSGQILSGVDLGSQAPAVLPLTKELADLAVERAGWLADRIDSRRAVPSRPLLWCCGSFAALCLALGLAASVMPRLAMTQCLRFFDPFGDHPPYSRVIFHVRPGDVRLVYGSELDVHVRTEGQPVDQLDLVLQYPAPQAEDVLPLFAEAGGEWRGAVANVRSEGKYFVRTRGGRSRRFQIDVATVPLIESVRFLVTPPAYTNKPAEEGPLPQGGLAGLPKTTVQVWAKSNRPLSGGRMEVPRLDGRTQVSLTPVAGPEATEITGSFQIRSPGKLVLTVADVAGQISDPFSATVTLLADERPFVRLLEPPLLSLATPVASLPVVIDAEDDYGISRLQLFRSLNDSTAAPLDIPVRTPSPTHSVESLMLPLSAYGLEAGDEIKLYARVEDNDPDGPKGSESTIAVVRIISQAEYERMVRTRQGIEVFLARYQQAERRLESLREEMERLRKKLKEAPGDQKLSRELSEELRRLTERSRQERDAVRLAAKNPLPYDLDKALSPHLDEIARRLDRLTRNSESLAARPELTHKALAEALDKMLDQLDQERKQLNRDALQPLETFAAAYRLMEDAARFVALAARQRALADRLQSLKNRERTDDPAIKSRMRDLQAEQDEIRTALLNLLDDIEEDAAKLPEDHALDTLRQSALEFAKDVRTSGASEAMTDAATGLAEFSGRRAYPAAQKAADILDRFVSRCQGTSREAGRCLGLKFQPSLAKCSADTVTQLLAEAGMQPGAGPGGSGGGYSARRNMLQNVGLYGLLPSLGEDAASGSARGAHGDLPGHGRGGRASAATPGDAAATANQSTGSASDTAIPLRYRKRVADYFQRIAEETGAR